MQWKVFCIDCEERRRKFCAAANGVISNKFAPSEEWYMHILRTQFISILTYDAGVWKSKKEQLRKLDVSFNNAERKVFGYKRFESVNGHFARFLYVTFRFLYYHIYFLLLYDCLKSEKSVVRMCAEESVDNEDVVKLCREFNLVLKWSSKAEIKESYCRSLLIMWESNGDNYMCTYYLFFTYFLSVMHILF